MPMMQSLARAGILLLPLFFSVRAVSAQGSGNSAEATLEQEYGAGEAALRENAPAVKAALLDSLYMSGLTLAAERKWLEAVLQLEKVQLLQPNYREVAGLLQTAKAHLQTAAPQPEQKATLRAKSLLSMGPLLAFAVLAPVLGFVALSPAVRARYHFWRSNYGEAARIYEKLLARHPSRVRHYPALAGIYLLQDRRDEPALKVYKAVLRLHLPFRHCEEINSIVAQKFLVEGRTDQDAIEVLENALKVEQRNYSLRQ